MFSREAMKSSLNPDRVPSKRYCRLSRLCSSITHLILSEPICLCSAAGELEAKLQKKNKSRRKKKRVTLNLRMWNLTYNLRIKIKVHWWSFSFNACYPVWSDALLCWCFSFQQTLRGYHGKAAAGWSNNKKCRNVCVRVVCTRTACLEGSPLMKRTSSCSGVTFSRHVGHRSKLSIPSHLQLVKDTTKWQY